MRVIRFTCVFVAFTISALANELDSKKTFVEKPTTLPPAEQHDKPPNITDAALPGIINPTSSEPLSVLSRNTSGDSSPNSGTVTPSSTVVSPIVPLVEPEPTTTPNDTSSTTTTTTTVNPNTTTTTVNPNTTTTTVNPNTTTTTVNPNTTTTTVNPNTTTTTVAPTTTTLNPNNTTTVAPTTTSVNPNTTTTPATNITTAMPPISTTACPPIPSGRHFDGLSFIGGIIFAVCLLAVAAFFWKFSKTFHEENYRTL